MASKNILAFSDQNFEAEVLKAGQPVLVDFTATWCGPCKALTPVLEKLADELVGKIKVGKVDTDSSPDVTAKYGVRGLPTVIVFKGGRPVAQHVGLTNRENLLKMINSEG